MMPSPGPAQPAIHKTEERAARPEGDYPREGHATQEPKRDQGAEDRAGNSGDESVGENHRRNVAHRTRCGRFEHQRRDESRGGASNPTADGAKSGDQ